MNQPDRRSTVADEASDRLALRGLVERYALGVDQRRAEDVAALFTADGVLAAPATPGGLEQPVERQGREAIAKAIRTVARYDQTLHAIVGQVVDVEPGGWHATGTTSCLAHHVHRADAGLVDLVWALHYHDQFVREPDGWRFARRVLEVEFIEERPVQAVRLPSGGWRS